MGTAYASGREQLGGSSNNTSAFDGKEARGRLRSGSVAAAAVIIKLSTGDEIRQAGNENELAEDRGRAHMQPNVCSS